MAPRAIVLTGAPGSGKTTLGRSIASILRVPFIARDDIRGGLLFSAGAWSEQLAQVPTGEEAVELFLQTVEALLRGGVSCVAEYVMRSQRPEDLDRLRGAGECLVIMTSCRQARQRLVQRNLSDRLIANPAVLRAIGVDSVEQHTEMKLDRMRRVENTMARDFPVPVLHVDTTDGYDLVMDAIIGFATMPLRTELPGDAARLGTVSGAAPPR